MSEAENEAERIISEEMHAEAITGALPFKTGFVEGAKWQASRPITHEQVEAAAKVLYGEHPVVSHVSGPIPWDDPEFDSWVERGLYLDRARLILEAEIGVQS